MTYNVQVEANPEGQFSIYFEEAERSHFTMIPNIVDDMDLDPFAFRLYAHFRRVAGENGRCWQGTNTLAVACHMSAGQVSESKATLVSQGLIRIDPMPNPGGGSPRHRIAILDIWAKNAAKYQAPSRHEPAPSHGEPAASHGETEEEPVKYIPEEDAAFSAIFKKFESSRGGMVNQLDSEQLQDLVKTYGYNWVAAAIEEANMARGNRFLTMKFIDAILERWFREGFKAPWKGKKPPGDEATPQAQGPRVKPPNLLTGDEINAFWDKQAEIQHAQS